MQGHLSEKNPWEMTGQELGFVYHGGKTKISEVDLSKIGQRDYGFYGEGFYVTTDKKYAKAYGGRVSEIGIADNATVLRASLKPEDAPNGLVEEVTNDYYNRTISKARERGKEDLLNDEIARIKTGPLAWIHAVDGYARSKDYDIVKYSEGEIVILTQRALK